MPIASARRRSTMTITGTIQLPAAFLPEEAVTVVFAASRAAAADSFKVVVVAVVTVVRVVVVVVSVVVVSVVVVSVVVVVEVVVTHTVSSVALHGTN
jgi:hypothetical protein